LNARQTTKDAQNQVLFEGRAGSLAVNTDGQPASLTYLYALRGYVLQWLDKINDEIARRERAQE
jgi:hypothetical protein